MNIDVGNKKKKVMVGSEGKVKSLKAIMFTFINDDYKRVYA